MLGGILRALYALTHESSQQPSAVDTIIIPILQMQKPSPGSSKQSHSMYVIGLGHEPSQTGSRAQALNTETYFLPVKGGLASSDIKSYYKGAMIKSVL